MVVRAIVAPGSEQIVERMFSSEGSECLRFEARVVGVPWSALASALIAADCGTPLGYLDPGGGLCVNPPPGEVVQASALYLLVDERQHASRQDVQHVVDGLPSGSD
jgi:voltage-gated potassium channel